MRYLYCFLFLLLITSMVRSQNITLSGYVEEAGSGEKLIGANIFSPETQKGTTTNEYGFYSLTVPAGGGTLVFSYVGYGRDTVQWESETDLEFNVRLSGAVQLEVVRVEAEKVRRIEEESRMSRNEVPVEQIQKLPALLGETDVLKTLQLLPGVQGGAEGTSGIFVRGGSIDQNLILVDGVPIFIPTHWLGIFSSFNSDAIKSVSITNGGFPARFGGRLSSVVEVNMRDGHLNEFHGSGQIGLVSSKILLEGPIVKEKSSFPLLSAALISTSFHVLSSRDHKPIKKITRFIHQLLNPNYFPVFYECANPPFPVLTFCPRFLIKSPFYESFLMETQRENGRNIDFLMTGHIPPIEVFRPLVRITISP